MFERGLVAMSADPFHYGHLDLVLRAKRQCEKLYLLVSNNDQKKGSYAFDLDERIEMVNRTIGGVEGIEVIRPPSLVLADTYLHYNCDVLFRGIRNTTDYEYERSQMEYHKLIYPAMHIEYMQSAKKWDTVSSSIVKAFASHSIDVADVVHPFVKRALERRVAKQYKIGITGCIATGKSHVADQLQMMIQGRLWTAHSYTNTPRVAVVRLDEIIRQVYEDDIPGAVAMRKSINDITESECGKTVLLESGKIDRKLLGDVIFTNDSVKSTIEEITKPLIHMRYRQAINNVGAVVIFEWAQIAEMNMADWTNYDVIVVDSPDREKLLAARGISAEMLAQRNKYQLNTEEKVAKLEAAAKKAGIGTVIRHTNIFDKNKFYSDETRELGEKVCNLFGLTHRTAKLSHSI